MSIPPKEIVKLGVKELATLIAHGKLTSVEVVEAFLGRIDKKNKKYNAFITVENRKKLLKEAEKADAEVKMCPKNKPLLGVPIAVKDIINTANLRTTGGTDGLRDNIPPADALVIQKLRAAGAIVIGKTNVHELAFGVTNINFAFGPAHNYVDPKLITGGSSGGSVLAVQSHMSPGALSSDTGGSSRIPASFTGIFGFRPTTQRYPKDFRIIPVSHTLDTIGVMANSLEDIKLMDSALALDEEDETKRERKCKLRFGIPKATLWTDIDVKVFPIFKNALRKLRKNGIELVESPDISTFVKKEKKEETIDMSLLSTSSKQIVGYEYFNDLQKYLEETKSKVTIEQIVEQIASPDVKERIAFISANPVSRDTYVNVVQNIRPNYQNIYANYLAQNNLDGIIYPTTKLSATPIATSVFTVELNGKTVPTFDTFISTQEFAPFINIPALSIPLVADCSSSLKDLPIGLDIAGKTGKDELLLSQARVIVDILQKGRAAPL